MTSKKRLRTAAEHKEPDSVHVFELSSNFTHGDISAEFSLTMIQAALEFGEYPVRC